MRVRKLSWAPDTTMCVRLRLQTLICTAMPLESRGYLFSPQNNTNRKCNFHTSSNPEIKTPLCQSLRLFRLLPCVRFVTPVTSALPCDLCHDSSPSEVDEETCDSLDSSGFLTPFLAQSVHTTSNSDLRGITVPAQGYRT